MTTIAIRPLSTFIVGFPDPNHSDPTAKFSWWKTCDTSEKNCGLKSQHLSFFFCLDGFFLDVRITSPIPISEARPVSSSSWSVSSCCCLCWIHCWAFGVGNEERRTTLALVQISEATVENEQLLFFEMLWWWKYGETVSLCFISLALRLWTAAGWSSKDAVMELGPRTWILALLMGDGSLWWYHMVPAVPINPKITTYKHVQRRSSTNTVSSPWVFALSLAIKSCSWSGAVETVDLPGLPSTWNLWFKRSCCKRSAVASACSWPLRCLDLFKKAAWWIYQHIGCHRGLALSALSSTIADAVSYGMYMGYPATI